MGGVLDLAPPIPSGVTRGLLPEASRQNLSRLARTASRLIGAPAAFIGVGDPAAPCVVAACGDKVPDDLLARVLNVAAEQGGALLVPDAGDDPRFRTSEALAARGLVAVHPLLDDLGRRIGFLGAMGLEPRSLSDDDREALEDLAALASRELGTACPPLAAAARGETAGQRTEITTLSHEIRTPLFAIQSAMRLLGEGCCPPESRKGRRLMAIAARNAERLIRLSHDVLSLAGLESGAIPLVAETCDGAGLLEEAAFYLEGLAEEAGVTLSIAAGDVRFEASPERIVQVLVNLVGNALKFSPAGSHVALEAVAHEGEVVFAIRDRGCGIPREDLERIFAPYHQVRPTAEAQGGVGLGLAISREIVRAHGGRLWAQSELGRGSAFYVALPARTRLRLRETRPR